MLMVQTSEYIEDSHHQYELASLVVACGCGCIYFICKVVYCNKQPFLSTSMTIWCVCDVPQLFESLSSVVPIELVGVAHCGVPRRALQCTTHYGTPYGVRT